MNHGTRAGVIQVISTALVDEKNGRKNKNVRNSYWRQNTKHFLELARCFALFFKSNRYYVISFFPLFEKPHRTFFTPIFPVTVSRCLLPEPPRLGMFSLPAQAAFLQPGADVQQQLLQLLVISQDNQLQTKKISSHKILAQPTPKRAFPPLLFQLPSAIFTLLLLQDGLQALVPQIFFLGNRSHLRTLGEIPSFV